MTIWKAAWWVLGFAVILIVVCAVAEIKAVYQTAQAATRTAAVQEEKLAQLAAVAYRTMKAARDRPGADACFELLEPEDMAGWYCIRWRLDKPRGAAPVPGG